MAWKYTQKFDEKGEEIGTATTLYSQTHNKALYVVQNTLKFFPSSLKQLG